MMNQYTYIYRLFTMLFLAAFIFGCSSGDDVPAANNQQNNNTGNGGSGGSGSGTNNDPDGDGVDTSVEVGENTDPQDPCSYVLTSQDYSVTTQAWRDLDCDGDGVTNGDEVDPDGNNQNNSNGTDPMDLCSFVESDQTVPTSLEWEQEDCDGDCQNNGIEQIYETDPLDPNSTFDFTDKLSTVYDNKTSFSFLTDNQGLSNIFYPPYYYQNYRYENELLTEYSAGDIDQGAFVTCVFSYDNEKISTISYDYFNIMVEHDANTITTYHDYSPPGLFGTRLELDPSSGRIIRIEKFLITSEPNEYDFLDITYEYDAAMENLIKTTIEEFNYDATTDTYVAIGTSSIEYTYYDNILNPSFSAYSKLEILHRLSEVFTLSQSFAILGNYMPVDAHFSKNLLKESIYPNGITTYVPNECSEENSHPFVVTRYNSSGNSNELRFFYYR